MISNKERIEHLSNSIYNFANDYRKYRNWYFFDKETKSVNNLKKLFDDEDRGVDFMCELSEMFYHFATDMDFENKQEKQFFDTLCSIFKEYNSFYKNYNKEYEINEIANSLMKYLKDADSYEYNDVYENDDQALNDMKKNLSTISGVETIIESLCSDINSFASENDLSNEDILNNFKTAGDLLIELNNYAKQFEKNNSKEMDM